MCSTSKTMEMMGKSSGGGGGGGSFSTGPRIISPIKVKQNPAEYVLLDVREKDELDGRDVEKPLNGAVCKPMGKLLTDAHNDMLDEYKSQKLVVYCNTGYRSGIACKALEDLGFDAYTLEMGLLGWTNYAALTPEFVTVLTVKDDIEKITLGLSFANAGLQQGKTVAVIMFGDGVELVQKPERLGGKLMYEDWKLNDPFKPVKGLMNKFVSEGGIVFACTTCVKSRGITYADLLDFVSPIQAPDFVRMVSQAGGSVQLT
eukprot:Clim_evm87s156 gene=Clim_evmTU87s156